MVSREILEKHALVSFSKVILGFFEKLTCACFSLMARETYHTITYPIARRCTNTRDGDEDEKTTKSKPSTFLLRALYKK